MDSKTAKQLSALHLQISKEFANIAKNLQKLEKLNVGQVIPTKKTAKAKATKKSTTKKEAKKVTATAGDDKKMSEALDNISKISSELKRGNDAVVDFLKKYEQFEKLYTK